MNSVFSIFNQLQNTAKKTEKEAILSANRDNRAMKNTLKFLLDDNVVTGISKKKLSKQIKVSSKLEISLFDELVQYLSKNNTGSDSDIAVVQNFIHCQPLEMQQFYKDIITKSLKLGLTYKTVNKALGYDLIPVWEVQQAYPIDKYKLKDGEWFSLTQKLNGIHGSYFKGNIISRQGKIINGMSHIIADIEKISLAVGYFVDGELIRKNIDAKSDEENFRIGTGIINSDTENKEEIKFVIYDLIGENEFVEGRSTLKYRVRRELLNNIDTMIKNQGLQHIEIVDCVYEGCDHAEIEKQLAIADSKDWEGLMLNRDTEYQCKRNNGILKVKSFKTSDLKVIGFEEGQGKYEGTLGSLVVEYKGCPVGVSGMTDSDRDYFWNHQAEILGRIVQVKYKQETKDKTGKPSLQFPSFQCIREIGKEVSYE